MNSALFKGSAHSVSGIRRRVAARAPYAVATDVPITRSEGPKLAEMSYSEQYDVLYQQPLNPKKAVPKPSKAAQDADPSSKPMFMSDVRSIDKRQRQGFNFIDSLYIGFIGGMHLLACAAPFTFSLGNFGLFCLMYFISGCLGITLTYHRLLSHKSFTVPKWFEYVLAYCGVLAVQGDPMEWASSHRYHHQHTDTPLDPHSPYEGFWWSHMGWLLDNKATLERVDLRHNVTDMEDDPYYKHLKKWYFAHVVAQFAVLFALGGWGALVWGGALRVCWVYHITWFVNSAAHVWGTQSYNTGDLSRNNWWVGLLAFGEGWHNNHHAFEYSARHGLEPQQFDMTWQVIRFLKFIGLASKVKLPTEKAKAAMAIN